MSQSSDTKLTAGKWMALIAALLGWMFDGFEMGLFPVVARPALAEVIRLEAATDDLPDLEKRIGFWNSIITAGFLIGAAAGGVVFGWLGDRLGRVRAMSLSILTYALCSGMAGFATAAYQIAIIRFLAALGMGGEWSLGVALVMEVWGGQSRALLAGLIGAAANVGYLLVGGLSLGLGSLRGSLLSLGLSGSWVEWRLLMICGALPALLTFFIRLYVPESASWEKEKARGATSSWASRDLLVVLAGIILSCLLLSVWRVTDSVGIRVLTVCQTLFLVGACYLYPIHGYLTRSGDLVMRGLILRRMALAAVISGIPLLATWGAVQWAPLWADQLRAKAGAVGSWKEYTQMSSAFGAVVGSLAGALLAGWIGRRIAYVLLCVASLGSVLYFYQFNTTFNLTFVLSAFLMGLFSAAFYGWLPLYLPELFPTRVRATGQGFGFNFGRILAAIGVLQVPELMGMPPDYATACSRLAAIYLCGVVLIWLAPETHGKPLPE